MHVHAQVRCGCAVVALVALPLVSNGADCKDLAKAGKRGEATDCYRKAVKKNPDDVDARNALGALLVEQKKYDDALAQFDAVLAKKPTDGVALNAKAMTLLAQKKVDEAFATL